MNRIPLGVGLNSRAAMTVAGLVGANNLLGSPLPRETLVDLAARLSPYPEAAFTALHGGLGVSAPRLDQPLYRSLEVAPLRVVVAVPELDDYPPREHDILPDPSLADAVHNIGHAALLVEALQTEDMDLLRDALADRLHVPYRSRYIPGYEAVIAVTRLGAIGGDAVRRGACRAGLREYGHDGSSARCRPPSKRGRQRRTWSLGVDMQGVVIGVVQ